jgi:tetratricopeptide (TPR) repeat protein
MILPRSRNFVLAASAYSIVSLVSTQIPLLNYLGYEFSALTALLATFVAGFLTIHIAKSEADTERPLTIGTFRNGLTLNTILLVIPLAVMLTNALFVKNCSLLDGLAFFFLLPVVTVWFASSLGFFCAVHYRFAKIVFVFMVVATFAYALALGYFTPAIYSYNFFYGFFPGLTYDETLTLTWTLVLFRVFTIFAGAVLLWMASLLLRHTTQSNPTWQKGIALLKALTAHRTRWGTLIVIVTVAAVFAFRCELGFESHRRFIQERLGERYETEHFTIFYATDSYGTDDITWIAAEHEFRLKQILLALNIPFHGRIESYVYPTVESKQRFIGTGTTNIAKPWSRQIHITKQSLEGTLKHELVHIVAGPFGVPVLAANLSTGLVEGLAVAIDWDWGNRTPHQYAAAMRKFGIFPDIKQLMRFTGFAAQSSSVSYVLAGSFCRFLIDRYGIRLMMQLYGSGNYEKLYGRPLDALIKEWQGFLDRIPVDLKDSDLIDATFRRPPIFRKVCARIVAERNNRARRKFSERDYASASQLYLESYNEGKGYEALSGYLMSELRLTRYASLTSALDSIMHEEFPSRYLPLFLNIGDAFWGLGNSDKALELYSRVAYADLSELFSEAAILRSYAAKDSLHDALFRYFVSDSNDSLRLKMLDSLQAASTWWLAPYLKGKLFYRLKKFEESVNVLEPLRLAGTEQSLEAIRLKTIGKCLLRLKRFQEAKTSFWLSLNHVGTEVAIHEVNDWVERCDWMSARGSASNPLDGSTKQKP